MYDMKGDEIMAVSYNLVSCLPRHHFGGIIMVKNMAMSIWIGFKTEQRGRRKLDIYRISPRFQKKPSDDLITSQS